MAFLSEIGKSVLSETGKSPKVAFGLFVLLALGGLINLIAFASPDWTMQGIIVGTSVSSSYFGLWKVCRHKLYGTVCKTLPSLSGWYAAVQAMMIFGLLASIAAGGLLLMFLFSSRFKQRNIVIIILVACIGAATFNVIGVAVFAAEFSTTTSVVWIGGSSFVRLRWAFYLCCVGTGLFVLCPVLAGLLLSQSTLIQRKG